MRLERALASFNRKERYLLFEWALDRQGFPLGDSFRESLYASTELRVPERSFVAMDYHLDWIYAALAWHAGDIRPGEVNRSKQTLELTATQQDVDALIGWTDGSDASHLILLEAKAYSGWNNKQLQHKANRLAAIFGDEGDRWPDVTPLLLLVGPKPSKGIDVAKWPTWMKRYRTLDLPKPDPERLKVTRCQQDGSPSALGGHWKVETTPWPA